MTLVLSKVALQKEYLVLLKRHKMHLKFIKNIHERNLEKKVENCKKRLFIFNFLE
jgi:hypothetical protein